MILFSLPRLWARSASRFLDRVNPGGTAYIIPVCLRLTGPVNAGYLELAVEHAVNRHESLRTSFRVRQGELVQLVAPIGTVPLEMADLRHLPDGIRDEAIQKRLHVELRRKFDLSGGPLVRAVLLNAGGEVHYLLLTLHHMIADGWSVNLLLKELSEYYYCSWEQRQISPPPLPVQYRDYSNWQRETEQVKAAEAQEAYWQRQLEGLAPVLHLPTDRPRRRIQRGRGSYYQFELPSEVFEGLARVSRQERCTLFVTILAAFQVLLARHTGEDDIAVGTPVANRTRLELEPLIGFLANTLVLRTRIVNSLTFRELLASVRKTVFGAYAHQDVPFEKVVQAVRPDRSLSYSTLFQAMLAMRPNPVKAFKLPRVTVEQISLDRGGSQCDLTLIMEEADQGLRGGFEYDTDLFDATTISRLAERLQTLLRAIAEDSNSALEELPLLPATERDLILVKWNDTREAYSECCLHQLVEDQAARTPDSVAVVYQDQSLTYRDLERRSNQLAHRLQELGVGLESRVGICLERSLELVIALLGVLKAGGAYLPLDPVYPPERLGFMLRDAGASVLLSSEALRHCIPDYEGDVLCLDTAAAELARRPDYPPASRAAPDNLAYVIYTSGSTGAPKGAMNSHRGICNRLLWMQSAYALSSADRVLQKTPATFDVSCGSSFGR